MLIRPKEFNRGNIYLSGGMQFAKNLGSGWREVCSAELKKMKYFPLDITALDISYSKIHGEMYLPERVEDHLKFKSNIRKHFIQTDLSLIQNMADATIVFYDESVRLGAGTISECQFAYNLGQPLFLVSDYPNMHKEVPGWLQGLTTAMFPSFEALNAYLKDLPVGILKKDVYGNHRSENQYLCSLCGTVFGKRKHRFVSRVQPLYCKSCVSIVDNTNEEHKDRYEFFMEHLTQNMENQEVDFNAFSHRTGAK